MTNFTTEIGRVFENLRFDKAVRTGSVGLAITTINNGIPNSAIDLRRNKSNSKVFSNPKRVLKIEVFAKGGGDKLLKVKEFKPPKKKFTNSEKRAKKKKRKR